uniref:Uncharacterized protein n=1 Tax=Rhizophora mucronata TaxID=61149 RepID=A0A2P2R084_RHIMU
MLEVKLIIFSLSFYCRIYVKSSFVVVAMS